MRPSTPTADCLTILCDRMANTIDQCLVGCSQRNREDHDWCSKGMQQLELVDLIRRLDLGGIGSARGERRNRCHRVANQHCMDDIQ